MNQDNYSTANQVSLIDLATIVVRRSRLFLVAFLVVVLAGIVYALMASERYEYVSLYQIAELAPDKTVEKPEKVIAVLESQKVPELKAVYQAEHDSRLPFDFGFSNPENTSLIRVVSEAPRMNSGDVAELHGEVLNYLKVRHDALLGSAKKGLETRIQSVQSTLDALKGTADTGQAVADIMQKQMELEGELVALTSAELLVVARESVERVAPNRKMIVIVAMLSGLVFALIAVFFAEFISLVREAMRAEN